MQRFLVTRRPPTMVERLLGRRRARRLRRRIGLAAVGTGIMLLRPKTALPVVAITCGAAVAVVVMTLAVSR